jgi:hypothetical protein
MGMKQNENEYKYSKIVTYILVAIIASIFIGIRIYTKHIEKQNKEILEKIMQHNIDTHRTPFLNINLLK